MQMFDSRYHRAVVRQTGRRTDGRTNTQSRTKKLALGFNCASPQSYDQTDGDSF